MKLWLLYAKGYDPSGETPYDFDAAERFDYDCNWAFVVRAESEAEARAIAQSKGSDETRNGYAGERFDTWLDPTVVICEALDAEGKPGVVVCDYHAG